MFAPWLASQTGPLSDDSHSAPDRSRLPRPLAATSARLRIAAASLFRVARRPHFPSCHVVFATLGLLDFVQTSMILSLGGDECNELARWVIRQWGLAGAAVYKFALVALVIGIIEWTALREAPAARRLASYSIVFGLIPVLVGVPLLVLHYWADSI